jgi:TolB-like protein/Tfp pilus assembly protein PilF
MIPATLAAAVVVVVGLAVYLASAARPRPLTMLAVLPFENLTGRPDSGPVIGGLTDELITQFGAILPSRLGVIGRTSVMRYKGETPSLEQIGRELGVDYVIEGSIRSEAARVRVSARLVRVSSQAQVWNETYELNEPSRLQLQEELAARVTVAVSRSLFPRNPAASARAHIPDPKAYEALVNGRFLERQDRPRAIQFFEQAAALDPAFAEPNAAMAAAYFGRAMSGAPPIEALEQARSAALRALRIDESNAEAHNALANVFYWRDWNWAESERHFVRALALNPSFAQAHHDYAYYLVTTGHPEAAVASLRRGVALDPLSPRVNVDAGWLLLQAHRFDEAIAQAKRALELQPGMREPEGCIARARMYQGQPSQSLLDYYLSSSSYNQALAHALLKHNGEAIRALQKAYDEHGLLLPLMKTEPAFEALRSDPAFRELVRKVGFP